MCKVFNKIEHQTCYVAKVLAQLALPDGDDHCPRVVQGLDGGSVAFTVPADLLDPERPVCLGGRTQAAAVAVPEAPVDKHG